MTELNHAGSIALDGRSERASEGSKPAESELTRPMSEMEPRGRKATDSSSTEQTNTAGITDADRERMGELVAEAHERREKLDSTRQVSQAVCADWRQRWRAGEGVLGDIAPGATVSAPTVSKHVHGDCKHPRGGER